METEQTHHGSAAEADSSSAGEPGLVPYDQSWRWHAHDEYFKRRGIGAWLDGEIPHRATNNYPFARQHAVLLSTLVNSLTAAGRLSANEPIQVWELGAGMGDFAGNLLLALRDGLGESGRALFERVTYLFSDVSATSLSEAIARPGLAPFVSTGKLVPALFDASWPSAIRTLDGNPWVGKPLLIIANYLCCALRTKVIWKKKDSWYELYARSAPEPGERAESADGAGLTGGWQGILGEHAWRPTPLSQIFKRPTDAAVVQQVLARYPEGKLAYPLAFVDLLEALPQLQRPDGLVVFSDYEDSSWSREVRFGECCPQLYGDSLGHPVYFPVFTAFARELGKEILDSGSRHGATRTVALFRPGDLPLAVREVFADHFVRTNSGQDRLDFEAAAQHLVELGNHQRGLLFLDRCLAIDPYDMQLYEQAALCCMEWDKPELALRYLHQGEATDRTRQHDFALLIGEVFFRAGRFEQALPHIEASLRAAAVPATYMALGKNYEGLGDRKRAYRAYKQALTLAPGFLPAEQAIADLRDAWCQSELDPRAVAQRWWADKVRELEVSEEP